ncbi:MAG TPA: hypothetical protein ENK16_08395, partial [Chromatiales bacterium]|nr:hypothetical protein [Chromatiales bacterium]
MPDSNIGRTPIIRGYFIESAAFVDTSEFTFRTLFHFFRQWWKRILISLLLGIVLSYAAFLFVTPIYRATIVFLPAAETESTQSQFLDQIGGIASLAGLT